MPVSTLTKLGRTCPLDFGAKTHGDKQLWESCKPAMREILLTPRMLLPEQRRQNFEMSHYQTTAIKLLREGDGSLATHLTKEVLRVASEKSRSYHMASALRPILNELLTRNLADTWDLLAPTLLNRGGRGFSYLEHLLGGRISDKEAPTVISVVPDDFLLTWCRQEGSKAAVAVASLIAPYSTHAKGISSLSDTVLKLLDEFGNDEQLLYALSSSMGSYFWSGSLVPFYERELTALKPLLKHKHLPVRAWAEREIAYATKAASKEQTRDEEKEIGRW